MKHNYGMQIQDCTDKITMSLAFRTKFRKKGCIWKNLKQFSRTRNGIAINFAMMPHCNLKIKFYINKGNISS
jgi:hypothetical protein